MVTAEQLDAARDVALRCFRSHSAFLFNTFVGRHSGGHRRPIREIQEKLAEDLHLLVRILVEAREKVTPEVTDAILVASGDGPPPSAESTWHELAVVSMLRLLVDAECQAAISRPMVGEPLPDRYPLPFDHPDDADRLRDMILRCGEDGITTLVDEVYKPSRGETLGDVEAGISREWGAARKRTPPDGDQDWMLVSEAVAELPFIRDLKALYRYVKANPGKLRLRDHPHHKQRKQAHRADVQRLAQIHNEREFAAMDGPAGDDLHAISEAGVEALAARMTRERQKKAGK